MENVCSPWVVREDFIIGTGVVTRCERGLSVGIVGERVVHGPEFVVDLARDAEGGVSLAPAPVTTLTGWHKGARARVVSVERTDVRLGIGACETRVTACILPDGDGIAGSINAL